MVSRNTMNMSLHNLLIQLIEYIEQNKYTQDILSVLSTKDMCTLQKRVKHSRWCKRVFRASCV